VASDRLPEFKAFCEQAFMLPRCRLLELDSFLIAPLQRVCKYPLLLKVLTGSASPSAKCDRALTRHCRNRKH
jgi:hypothetical protein